MTTANPFPGLRPFESGETHLFFGRDGQSEELIRRLGRGRFLAVVGTSGSGKSSLVRAGLLPALQGGLMASAGSDWRIAMFRPGHDPVGNLARVLTTPEVFGSEEAREADMQAALTEATLRRSSLGLLEAVRQARGASGPGGRPRLLPYENLLVVVDQFEELFRFRQLIEVENSKEDAAAFVRLLLEAGGRPEEKIYVVLTMRSDFLGDCAQFQGLPEAINDGQYLIPRMTRDERREAVTGPVAVGGGRITDPLVNQLLNDMGDNPDQLPILQHALMRTWDYWLEHRRNGEPIDLPHYHAVGGMGEALSRHAEEAYGELGETGQEQSARQRIAEKLFKALTEKGADNREIRRPVELGEAAAITEASAVEVAAVVEVFRRPGRSFLMPPAGVPLDADSLIDISHESLIRNWERLKRWTEEEAQSARIYRRLAETAVLHKAGEEALYKDPALQFALDWREKSRPNAVWARRYHPEFEAAMSFLGASVSARKADIRKGIVFKLALLATIFLSILFLLAAGASVYAYNRMSVAVAAEARANKALREAEAAQSQAEAARSYAQARAQVAQADAAQAREDKQDATEQLNKAEVALDKAKAEKAEADRRAVAAGEREEQANAAFRRAEVARREAEVKKQEAEAQSVLNAQAAEKNAADAEQTRQVLYPVAINLAQQAYEANDIERGRAMLGIQSYFIRNTPGFEWFYLNRLLNYEMATIKPPGDGLNFVAATPDGKTLVIASGELLAFRNLDTGKIETVPSDGAGDDFSVGCLAVSPDGKKLALGNSNPGKPSVKLFDVESRKELGSLNAERLPVNGVAFTPDSKRVVAVTARAPNVEGSGNVWDVDTLALTNVRFPAPAHNEFALSPDNKTIALAFGNAVELFDLSTGEDAGRLPVSSQIVSLAYSPNGNRLAAATLATEILVWDLKEPRSQIRHKFKSSPFSVAFSPDGEYFAAGFMNGSISICHAATPSLCAVLKGHRETVTSVSFSPDGRFLYSGDNRSSGPVAFSSGDTTAVKIWDVAAALREQLPVSPIRDETVNLLAYSPDGRTLVATGDNSRVMLLDAETNRLVRTLYETERSVSSAAFSPDGRLLATVDDEGLQLWSVPDGARAGALLEAKGRTAVTFSPDGSLLVTATPGGGVKVWEVATRKLVRELHKGEADRWVEHVAFTGDGTLVFRRKNAVEFWDAAQGKQLRRFVVEESDEGGVYALAYTPDGKMIAAGGYMGKVVLYNAHTFNVLATVELHRENITYLTFSPDGKTLLTGGEYGTLKLWSTASFRELLALSGYGTPIRDAAFSPDGTKLAIVDNVSNLRVWHAPAVTRVGEKTRPAGLGRAQDVALISRSGRAPRGR